MAWLSFLKSKNFDPVQFEKELAALARRIATNERNVAKYAYQSKRLRRFVLVYGLISYFCFVAYLCASSGMELSNVTKWQWAHIVAVPIGVMALMKGITKMYQMRIERAETTVQILKDEHSEKIEELKEKTKFSSTQALLNRFADGGDLSAQLDEELAEKQRQLDEIKKLSLEQEEITKSFAAYPQQQQQGRGWLDSIVDTVVGSDELSPNNRFALICVKCHSHNGLAPPGMQPKDVKYICPNCGVANGVAVDDSVRVTAPVAQEAVVAPVEKNE